jgi:mannose-6-phosphate isomerase
MRALIGESALERLASTIHVGLPPREGEEGRFRELEGLVRRSQQKSKSDEVEVEVEQTNKDQKEALKEVFEILMTAPSTRIQSTLRSLVSRYTSTSSSDPLSTCQTTSERTLLPLVLELNDQFPDDVGVLCSFILNVVELDVGKSVFLKADEPHAYISGGESQYWGARQ